MPQTLDIKFKISKYMETCARVYIIHNMGVDIT